MRLTADVVQQSPVSINPVFERELNLRGLKIPVIENLGSTEDQFDCVDLTDNDIIKLENFPVLKKLKSLLLSNNRICRIGPGLGRNIPNLETLIMTNNQISRLQDLDQLSDLPNLERVSFLKNPVTVVDNYRLYVISLLPKLRHLDFQKVRMSERERAATMFKDRAPATKSDLEAASTTKQQQPQQLTAEQKRLIMNAIQKAKSMDEINDLEAMLKAGRLHDADLAKLQAFASDSMQTD